MTLTGISLTLNAMPATPTLLLVSCPIVPATCVPWPSMSTGVSSSQMKSYGDTKRSVPPRSVAAANGTSMVPSDGNRTPSMRCCEVEAERHVAIRQTAVEHGHGHRGSRSGVDIPRALHVERRIVPLPRVERVVRYKQGPYPVSRLRVFDVRLRVQAPRHRFGIGGWIEGDDVERGVREVRRAVAVDRRNHRLLRRRRRAEPELDDDAAVQILRGARAAAEYEISGRACGAWRIVAQTAVDARRGKPGDRTRARRERVLCRERCQPQNC